MIKSYKALSLNEGEQLLISYDERSDDQMLVDYGFSLGPGENQRTFLEITLREIVELGESHIIIEINCKLI